METYISMLRGINVSGQKLIKMDGLKDLFIKMGFNNVSTYIQSGNVVFQSPKKDPSVLSNSIEKKIAGKYKFEVPVITRGLNDFRIAFDKNPLLKQKNIDVEKLHVTFLDPIPKKENTDKIKDLDFGKDKFIVLGREVYLYCPDGYGNTKLNNTFFEKKLQVRATTRNLRTARELISMAEAIK